MLEDVNAGFHAAVLNRKGMSVGGVSMQNCASAGNRTRIYCLEGNNANLYTTDA